MTCDKCQAKAVQTCVCGRCEREEDSSERFFSCVECAGSVAETHERIRGRAIFWAIIDPSSDDAR